jgi:hypothetical protein
VSRGLGSRQHDVLRALGSRGHLPPWERWQLLDALASGGTRGEVESTRHALKTLARRGLVELGYDWLAGRALQARLTLTPAERELEAARERELEHTQHEVLMLVAAWAATAR